MLLPHQIEYVAPIDIPEINLIEPIDISDYIGNYEIFVNQFAQKLNTSNYLVFQNNEKVVFYKLKNSDDVGCAISTCICITKNLYVKVIRENTEIFSSNLEMLPQNMKISKWSQMSNLLSKFRDELNEDYENRNHLIDRALYYLEKAKAVDEDFIHHGKLDIIINQIENLKKIKLSYDSETIIFAFLIYAHSAATYNILKKNLILPHVSYLRHISSHLHITPDHSSVSNDENLTRNTKCKQKKKNFVHIRIISSKKEKQKAM